MCLVAIQHGHNRKLYLCKVCNKKAEQISVILIHFLRVCWWIKDRGSYCPDFWCFAPIVQRKPVFSTLFFIYKRKFSRPWRCIKAQPNRLNHTCFLVMLVDGVQIHLISDFKVTEQEWPVRGVKSEIWRNVCLCFYDYTLFDTNCSVTVKVFRFLISFSSFFLWKSLWKLFGASLNMSQ